MDEKVGKLWAKYLTKKTSSIYEEEQVFFSERSRALKIFYHLLGGDKGKSINITDKRFIKTSRTFFEKISGTGKTFFLSWQDEKGIYLPASLAYFPSKKYNEMHYYWLIAMLSKININSNNIIEENMKTISFLVEKYSGFREFYDYAQEFMIKNSLEFLNHQYLSPLWIYPALSNSNKLLDFDDEDEPLREKEKQDETETLKMKKKAEQINDKKETDGLLLFLPESLMSLLEQVNVDRQENDTFDEDALYNAEILDEITLGQKDANLSSRLKMDLDISVETLEEYPLGKGHFIDEWDYKKECYLKNYVCIKPFIWINVEPIKLPQRHVKMMKKIQYELDLMELDRIKRDNLPYGDEINIDSWIDYKSHKNCSNHSQRFFETYERKTRDISTLILADVSLSTEAGITQEIRVIDMIKDALMVFSESLYRLQDRFAIYTFSSIKNTKVNFHIIKNFKEKYTDLARGRINTIKPGYYTRMGAGIRESAKILDKQQSKNKLLLILSDGKPNDVDKYDGRYGIEDTKKAIEEVKKKGIIPFCITIDMDAKEYLPYLFGQNAYAVIRDPKKLPKVLPEIYMNLTKGN
ncbi:nitric oxide reductase activation protein NorD [Arcobacter sp.]|uniref:nitric oxide reductase activation protein NorD n=1 Tax=unclassified Arcobacter TaxID=2593671 RepID=UPI003B005F50